LEDKLEKDKTRVRLLCGNGLWLTKMKKISQYINRLCRTLRIYDQKIRQTPSSTNTLA